jgi:sugar phosphate isomerase/epimerase
MAADFEGTLKKVSEIGYKYVEFAGYFDKSAEEIKALLDKYGLVCESVHQRLSANDDDKMAAEIEFLKTIGVKYVFIPWYEKNDVAGSETWGNTVSEFKKAAAALMRAGMTLGYHNHDFEFARYDGKFLHDHIFDEIGRENIIPELDTCWIRYAGLDPAEKIREFSGYVPVVHLKDFTCKRLASGPVYDLIGGESVVKEDNGFRFRPVGQGMQNFDEILAACEAAGTDTVIVEQDASYEEGEISAVTASYEFLKSRYGL